MRTVRIPRMEVGIEQALKDAASVGFDLEKVLEIPANLVYMCGADLERYYLHPLPPGKDIADGPTACGAFIEMPHDAAGPLTGQGLLDIITSPSEEVCRICLQLLGDTGISVDYRNAVSVMTEATQLLSDIREIDDPSDISVGRMVENLYAVQDSKRAAHLDALDDESAAIDAKLLEVKAEIVPLIAATASRAPAATSPMHVVLLSSYSQVAGAGDEDLLELWARLLCRSSTEAPGSRTSKRAFVAVEEEFIASFRDGDVFKRMPTMDLGELPDGMDLTELVEMAQMFMENAEKGASMKDLFQEAVAVLSV